MSSRVTLMRDGALLSWRYLQTCLPMGGAERVPCFALLVCAAFALPTKLSLSQPMSFLTSTLLILLEGSDQAAKWGLVAGWD